MIVINWGHVIIFCVLASLVRTALFGIMSYQAVLTSFGTSLTSFLLTGTICYIGYKFYIRKTAK